MADLTAAQTANLGMGDNPFLGQSNPYLTGTINTAAQNMVNQYNQSTQPAFNAAMVNSGSFGNAGVAQMNSQAQNMLQQNLGNLNNQMLSQDYSNQQQEYNWQQQQLQNQNQFTASQAQQNNQWNLGFDQSVYNDTYNQNMNNLQVGMNLLGAANQYGQQDLTNATTQQNAPLNYYQQFSNIANGIGQGYGTGTNVTGTTSNPITSALGGAQLGNAAVNYWNTQSGNTPQQTTSQVNAFQNFGDSSNWFGTGTGS